jgi:hypothetical protein
MTFNVGSSGIVMGLNQDGVSFAGAYGSSVALYQGSNTFFAGTAPLPPDTLFFAGYKDDFSECGTLTFQTDAGTQLLISESPIGSPAIIVGISGGSVGFFGSAAVAKPTAVPVTAAGIHAALVSLGLIS